MAPPWPAAAYLVLSFGIVDDGGPLLSVGLASVLYLTYLVWLGPATVVMIRRAGPSGRSGTGCGTSRCSANRRSTVARVKGDDRPTTDRIEGERREPGDRPWRRLPPHCEASAPPVAAKPNGRADMSGAVCVAGS